MPPVPVGIGYPPYVGRGLESTGAVPAEYELPAPELEVPLPFSDSCFSGLTGRTWLPSVFPYALTLPYVLGLNLFDWNRFQCGRESTGEDKEKARINKETCILELSCLIQIAYKHRVDRQGLFYDIQLQPTNERLGKAKGETGSVKLRRPQEAD